MRTNILTYGSPCMSLNISYGVIAVHTIVIVVVVVVVVFVFCGRRVAQEFTPLE